jgi:hypothetical protein
LSATRNLPPAGFAPAAGAPLGPRFPVRDVFPLPDPRLAMRGIMARPAPMWQSTLSAPPCVILGLARHAPVLQGKPAHTRQSFLHCPCPMRSVKMRPTITAMPRGRPSSPARPTRARTTRGDR